MPLRQTGAQKPRGGTGEESACFDDVQQSGLEWLFSCLDSRLFTGGPQSPAKSLILDHRG